ncbi:unnamed protein product [Prorocentrum cordatum]|uniref:SURF1-like protein n=1 Tax=Prorocentrum cordatum TaxID=2364126 RepID=A0ABN9UMX0_9DINO|nr:unnamed protein product [Polarella glacialis]
MDKGTSQAQRLSLHSLQVPRYALAASEACGPWRLAFVGLQTSLALAAGKHSLVDHIDFLEPSESRLESWDDDRNEGYILTQDCDHACRPQGHSVYRIEGVIRSNRDGKTIGVKRLVLRPRLETIRVDKKWARVTVQDINQTPWAKKAAAQLSPAAPCACDAGPAGFELGQARLALVLPRQADKAGRGERRSTERGGNRPGGGDLASHLASLENSLDGGFQADDLRKRVDGLKDKCMKTSGRRGGAAAPASERPAERQTPDDILSQRVAEARATGEDAQVAEPWELGSPTGVAQWAEALERNLADDNCSVARWLALAPTRVESEAVASSHGALWDGELGVQGPDPTRVAFVTHLGAPIDPGPICPDASEQGGGACAGAHPSLSGAGVDVAIAPDEKASIDRASQAGARPVLHRRQKEKRALEETRIKAAELLQAKKEVRKVRAKKREEKKRRKEENEVKAGQYQVIKNTDKIRKWHKNARKQLQKMGPEQIQKLLG